MKRITLNALILLTVASSAYLSMCYVINHFSLAERRASVWMIPYLQRKGGQEQRMMNDYDATRKYDIIVLGSSHAYRGYDPREFSKQNYQLFNSGSSAQHSIASNILVNEFLSTDCASLVIVDLYDKVFEGEGMECSTKLIQNASTDNVAWQIVKRQPEMRTLNAFTSRIFSKYAPNEIESKGYIKSGYCTKADTLKLFSNYTVAPFVAQRKFIRSLNQLLYSLENRKLKYVLVSHPQPDIKGLRNYHEQFLQSVEEIIRVHQASYVDMTFDDRFDKYTCFADENHMNQTGVTLFNQIIIDSLKQLNYLPSP